MNPVILQSLELMLFGLIGVFASLGVLYIAVKLMSAIFPYKPDKEEKE